jgi:hypothetical protein
MSLLVKTLPMPDESLQGFLMRVSQLNIVPQAKFLLADIGLKFKARYTVSELEVMAQYLDMDVEPLASRNPNALASSVLLRAPFQRVGHSPVCPECLAEQGYLRQAWQHQLVTACPVHNICLAESCPSCTQPLNNLRSRIEWCDCGQSLAAIEGEVAAVDELAIAALLSGRPHSARASLPEPLQETTPPADIADALCFLDQHLTVTVPETDRVSKSPRSKSLADSQMALARISALLHQWPLGFNQAIAAKLSQGDGPGLAKRLGGWYRALRHRFADPGYDFIREALGRQLAEKFDGHLNLRISSIDPTHLQDKCWLSPAEAARLIGIGSSLLAMAVTTGEVQGKVVVSGKNRFVSLHKDTVAAIRKNRLAYLTAVEVRRRLGVSKTLFERLMQAGALTKKTKKQRPALVSAEYLAKDVDQLLRDLTAVPVGRHLEAVEQIGLQDISVRNGISNQLICSVLQKVLSREICPVVCVPGVTGLAALRFDLSEIKSALNQSQTEPTMTITDLARMQNWKHESIKAWITTGLLEARVEQIGTRKQTVIPLSSLLRFMSRHVVLADAAARTGSQSNWILRGLMPAGVKPVSAPKTSAGALRGVLLSVDDLIRAAQLNKRGGTAAGNEANQHALEGRSADLQGVA